MKKFLCLSLCMATAAGAWLMPATARAESVGLEMAVPEGVYIFVHGKRNDERAFLDKHWAVVWQELKKTNIHEEIKKLILSNAPASEAEAAAQHMDQVCGLLSAVDWAGLFQEEMVFAGRMMFPVPEYVVLTRPNKESMEKNVAALQAIFNAASESQPGVSVTQTEVNGAKTWTMTWSGVPTQLSMFHVNDVVGFGMGEGLTRNALNTLTGGESMPALVKTARFKTAFEGLPKAEDESVFFDMQMLVNGLDTMMKGMMPPPPAEGETTADGEPATAEGQMPDEAAQWMKLMHACFSEMRMLDYSAAVGYTDGLKTYNVSKAALAKDAKERTFYKALGKPNAVKKFSEYVPKGATSFSVSSGFDFGGFYNAAIEFTKANVPNGEGYVGQWEAMQEQIGFNVKNDLLSWLGTGGVSVSLPGSSPMGMGGDWVMMIEVTDAAAADEKISTWINQLATIMQQNGQMLNPQPTAIAGNEKFFTLTHPQLAMFLRPVVGVHGKHLILASGSGAIESVLNTADGKTPSILENERFKNEGLQPDAPVQSISFTDMRGTFKGYAMGMGMAGGMGAMFTAGMPPEQGQAAQAVLGILAKLAPVVAAMDFYESTASVTTFDGQTYMTKTVTTYQPFKEEPAAAE